MPDTVTTDAPSTEQAPPVSEAPPTPSPDVTTPPSAPAPAAPDASGTPAADGDAPNEQSSEELTDAQLAEIEFSDDDVKEFIDAFGPKFRDSAAWKEAVRAEANQLRDQERQEAAKQPAADALYNALSQQTAGYLQKVAAYAEGEEIDAGELANNVAYVQEWSEATTRRESFVQVDSALHELALEVNKGKPFAEDDDVQKLYAEAAGEHQALLDQATRQRTSSNPREREKAAQTAAHAQAIYAQKAIRLAFELGKRQGVAEGTADVDKRTEQVAQKAVAAKAKEALLRARNLNGNAAAGVSGGTEGPSRTDLDLAAASTLPISELKAIRERQRRGE